jgi:hypothetical protein
VFIRDITNCGDRNANCLRQPVDVRVPLGIPRFAVIGIQLEGDQTLSDRRCHSTPGGIVIQNRVTPLPEHRVKFLAVNPELCFVLKPLAVEINFLVRTQSAVEEQEFVAIDRRPTDPSGVIDNEQSSVEEIVAAQC